MDSKSYTEALPRASTNKSPQENTKTNKIQYKPKTLLVHPFRKSNNGSEDISEKTIKPYLLETPKDIKRKTPLLQIPSEYSKRPKLYKNCNDIINTIQTNKENTSENNSTQVQTDTTDAKENTSQTEMIDKPTEKDNSNCQSENLQTCQTKVKCQHRCCCQIENACCSVRAQNCNGKSGLPEAKCSGNVEGLSKCCSCQSQPVKVIFAPAMMPGMPGIFGPVPGIPYVMKPSSKVGDQVKIFDLFFF